MLYMCSLTQILRRHLVDIESLQHVTQSVTTHQIEGESRLVDTRLRKEPQCDEFQFSCWLHC